MKPCTPLRARWVSGEVAWALWQESRDHRTRSLVQESLVLFSSKADTRCRQVGSSQAPVSVGSVCGLKAMLSHAVVTHADTHITQFPNAVVTHLSHVIVPWPSRLSHGPSHGQEVFSGVTSVVTLSSLGCLVVCRPFSTPLAPQ